MVFVQGSTKGCLLILTTTTTFMMMGLFVCTVDGFANSSSGSSNSGRGFGRISSTSSSTPKKNKPDTVIGVTIKEKKYRKKNPIVEASSIVDDSKDYTKTNPTTILPIHQEQILLDKWGLPPPTTEDIFPPLSKDTELIPVQRGRNYTLNEIQESLQQHIPLALDRWFDHTGVERKSATTRTNTNENYKPMQLQLLHISPPVLVIENFFTSKECEETQLVAFPNHHHAVSSNNSVLHKPDFAPHRVESKTFSPLLAQSIRSSTSWFCYYHSVPTLLAKARDILGIPLERMEEPQILQYQVGQQFSWHCDEIPTAQLFNGGQRLATLLVYLNTVQSLSGGGTVFRDLRRDNGCTNSDNDNEDNTNTNDNTIHINMDERLTVRPVQGRALLFFPAFQDGTPDDRTLHQGEIVTDGEKCIIQMWIHQYSYQAAIPPGNRQCDARVNVDRVSQQLGYNIGETTTT